jgi:hypothetical protein
MRALFCGMLASALIACAGSGSGPGPSDTYSGTYRLISINGQSLPYVISFGDGDKSEELSGAFTLTDDGTDGGSFTEVSTTRITTGGQVRTENRSGAGSYTRYGGAVSFSMVGSQEFGTIAGGKLTIDMVSITGSPVRVYQK